MCLELYTIVTLSSSYICYVYLQIRLISYQNKTSYSIFLFISIVKMEISKRNPLEFYICTIVQNSARITS